MTSATSGSVCRVHAVGSCRLPCVAIGAGLRMVGAVDTESIAEATSGRSRVRGAGIDECMRVLIPLGARCSQRRESKGDLWRAGVTNVQRRPRSESSVTCCHGRPNPLAERREPQAQAARRELQRRPDSRRSSTGGALCACS